MNAIVSMSKQGSCIFTFHLQISSQPLMLLISLHLEKVSLHIIMQSVDGKQLVDVSNFVQYFSAYFLADFAIGACA